MDFYGIQKLCHEIAREKGWYDEDMIGPEMWHDHKRVSQILMLIVAELGEAMESVRDDDIDQFKIELADATIILTALADRLGFDLEKAILDKCEFN